MPFWLVGCQPRFKNFFSRLRGLRSAAKLFPEYSRDCSLYITMKSLLTQKPADGSRAYGADLEMRLLGVRPLTLVLSRPLKPRPACFSTPLWRVLIAGLHGRTGRHQLELTVRLELGHFFPGPLERKLVPRRIIRRRCVLHGRGKKRFTRCKRRAVCF